MSKRTKRVIVALGLCCFMLFGTAKAKAETLWFKFYFADDKTTTAYENTAKKADNEQNWYLTLNNYNVETGATNSTLSTTNIFGCKLHRTYSDNVDIYRTYKGYVTAKKIAYQTTVSKGDTMRLHGKKDNTSTSTKGLRVYGKYTP